MSTKSRILMVGDVVRLLDWSALVDHRGIFSNVLWRRKMSRSIGAETPIERINQENGCAFVGRHWWPLSHLELVEVGE